MKLGMIQRINKKLSGSTDSYKMMDFKRKPTSDSAQQKLGRQNTRHVNEPKSLELSIIKSG